MERLTKNYSPILLFLISLLVSIPGGLPAIDNFESLKVLHSELPSYPTSMIYVGIYEGSAQVVVNVDESGELKDVYVTAFTHPEFGRLAEKYIWKWTFQPAKLNGEPLGVIKVFDFGFEDRRGVFAVGVQESVAAMFKFGRTAESKRIHSPMELDEIPVPVKVTTPLFPLEYKGQNIKGHADVLFYIDSDGSIRMPHVTDFSHESFGQTALFAVREWKFRPPMVRGKPVAILAHQQFNFSEKSN